MQDINRLEDLVRAWINEYRQQRFVSERAACKLLGISTLTIRELIKRKKINYVCLQGKIFIPFDMEYVLKDNLALDIDALEKDAQDNDPDKKPFVA